MRERVCIVDFDLDSPGIGTLLSADESGLTASWGLVDFLLERDFQPPFEDYWHRCDRVSAEGEIRVMPAGRLDDRYADKLARVDLEEVPSSKESGLRQLLMKIKDSLSPDWILLDARTGISETAGQLLSGIAHLNVLLGSTQEQSWLGLDRVLDRLGKDRVLRNQTQGEVLLIHAMVSADAEIGALARERFSAKAEHAFDERFYAESPDDGDERSDIWTVDDRESTDAPHVSWPVTYESRLSNFGDITVIADLLCTPPYAEIAEQIANRFIPEEQT